MKTKHCTEIAYKQTAKFPNLSGMPGTKKTSFDFFVFSCVYLFELLAAISMVEFEGKLEIQPTTLYYSPQSAKVLLFSRVSALSYLMTIDFFKNSRFFCVNPFRPSSHCKTYCVVELDFTLNCSPQNIKLVKLLCSFFLIVSPKRYNQETEASSSLPMTNFSKKRQNCD